MPSESSPMSALLDGMPEPSEFADTIPIPPEAVEQPATESPVITDVHYTDTESSTVNDDVFDPEIHAAGPNGTGIKTKSGKYRRKPGRKKAVGEPGTVNTPGNVQSGDVIDPNKMMKAKQVAQVCTAATFILGQIICGAEGAPIVMPEHSINEPLEFETAYTQAFYLSNREVNLPPWILIALVLGNYTARRATMPNTKSRIARMWQSIKRSTVRLYLWCRGM